MAIIKKDQPMPQRPIVTILYGQPGTGKTSTANTAVNPLLIDCDRGADRAVGRPDTIVANCWEDVIADQQYFNEYKTIVIDTAKAVLDDYLWTFCVRTDKSLTTKYGNTNDIKVYGAIGAKFKEFVNYIRATGCDLIIIAHAKEDKGNDGITKVYPDVTGSSKDLLYRIADQIGYISMINGKRVISFNPSDHVVGKNTAGLDSIIIPDYSTPEHKDFTANLIADVKKAIQSKDAAQVELLKKLEELTPKVNAVKCADDANELIPLIEELPIAQQKALKMSLVKSLKGIAVVNKDTKRFEDESQHNDN